MSREPLCFACISSLVAIPREDFVRCPKCGGFRRPGERLTIPAPPVLRNVRAGRIIRAGSSR